MALIAQYLARGRWLLIQARLGTLTALMRELRIKIFRKEYRFSEGELSRARSCRFGFLRPRLGLRSCLGFLVGFIFLSINTNTTRNRQGLFKILNKQEPTIRCFDMYALRENPQDVL